ncbi:sensor domain-containing protein [Oceanobacillus piezotolerans]|uniref:sensor domain-containing protein n=1 Tax=Oceanobacillus piezotolerans TaxID=2448030 RepID=UPI0013142096|nr:bifunctional diguanylate cyclase/phosphodiesterase [Oceanobacillus piezotolerans]
MTYTSQLEIPPKKLQNIALALNKSATVSITDQEGTIHFVNEIFCHLAKYNQDELIGKNVKMLNADCHLPAFYNVIRETVESGKIWRGEMKNKAKDGTYYWTDTSIIPFISDEKLYQYIAISYEITEQKTYEQSLEKMAYMDPNTELPNRNYLIKWMENHSFLIDDSVTILFLNLDQFKKINDNFGHDVGDALIQQISKRIKHSIRESDLLIRLNGDNFGIILEKNTNKKEIEQIARNILKQSRAPLQVDHHEMTIKLSIGISSKIYDPKVNDAKEFIRSALQEANIAMYHVKKNGGDDYSFSMDNQKIHMDRSLLIELELKNALINNEFHIVYQPLINLKKNNIVGVEALLRWKNKQLGTVSPGEFIPILEKTGKIIEVGKWILRTVCNQMKRWQENGIFLERISVNVSPIQFKEQSFIDDLKQIIDETQLDASYLEIEITEGTILEIANVSKTLQKLQGLGIKVSIDDFGTGYSSLSYLKQLPIDTLKIDKSFIDDLDTDGEIIVNTIINMGKNLRFRIIAEGIETPHQLKYLKQQQCHEGQGYFFSKPVGHEQIPILYQELQVTK